MVETVAWGVIAIVILVISFVFVPIAIFAPMFMGNYLEVKKCKKCNSREFERWSEGLVRKSKCLNCGEVYSRKANKKISSLENQGGDVKLNRKNSESYGIDVFSGDGGSSGGGGSSRNF